MTTKSEALEQIASLATTHNISLDEIAEKIHARTNSTEATTEYKASLASQIFAYIGGILAFSGISIFIAMQWDSMNAFARVIITLGTGIALYVFAIVAAEKNRNSRAVTPLFLLSNIFQPTGLLVLLHEFSSGGEPRHALLFVSFVMALQQALTFYKQKFALLLFFAIAFGCTFFVTIFDLLDVQYNYAEMAIGLSLGMVSYGISKYGFRNMTGFFYLVSSLLFLAGIYDLLNNSSAEPLFTAFAALTVYLSVVLKSRTLLTVGTISLIAYIGNYSFEHFTNSIGWPLTLILMGLILIGISFFAMRLNKQIKSTA